MPALELRRIVHRSDPALRSSSSGPVARILAQATGLLDMPRAGTAIPLLPLKPGLVEFERAAVLGYGAHDGIRRAVGDVRLDLQCHRHRCPDEPHQVGDHLVGDAAGIVHHSSASG